MIEEIKRVELCIESEDEFDKVSSQVNIKTFIDNHKSLLSTSELQAAKDLHRYFGSSWRNANIQQKMDNCLFTLVQFARKKT